MEHQDLDDLRVWLVGEKATKTEEGARFSASAYLFVPDPDKPSTWKIRIEETPGNVTVDQLGRAAAALSGKGFMGNPTQGIAGKRAAMAKRLIGLYRSHKVADADIPDYLFAIAGMSMPGKKELAFATGFKTIQQSDGRYRWVMLSSGAFEDRDEEIVSKGLLESALDFAENYDYRGTINIWHTKGSDIGNCDGQWLVGEPPFLLETGLFDETPAGRSAGAYYLAHASEKGGSIELYASRDDDGVWLPPGVIIRRSILPSQWAAFPWSSLAVKEHKMSKKREEVVSEFAGALGITTDDAEKVLSHLEAGSKQLADFGVRWKEADTDTETPATVEETATAPTEAVTETVTDAVVAAVEPAQVEAVAEIADTAASEMEVVLTPDAMTAIVTEAVTAIRAEITSTMDALAQKLEAVMQTVTTMGEQQLASVAVTKELQDTVTALKRTDDAKIKDKVANLPRATVKALQPLAVRPSQRTPEDAALPDVETESMLDRARKVLYG